MINKKDVLDQLIANLKKELAEAESIAKSSRDFIGQDDMKAEGKYDTRAIEASYLASAQQKRVDELKIDIQMLEETDLNVTSRLQMGSLALIEFNNTRRYYFLTSASGGTMLTFNNDTVLVISVFSPLGNAALGLSAGESFEVETPKECRTYQVIEVY